MVESPDGGFTLYPTNHIGSHIQPHKGLLEYLADQVMAQLAAQAQEPEASEAEDGFCPGARSGEPSSEATSFYFSAGGSVCNCAPCAIIRRLV